MTRVAVTHDVPQIFIPVGSLAEVKALGLPTRNISTCSERDDRNNYGCPLWEHCDRTFRGDRPHNEIVRTIGTNGDVRFIARPCFMTVQAELDSVDKNTLVQVIGGEGDSYTYRGSQKAHIKRDPDCNDCMQGKCEKWVDVAEIPAVCDQFPPAATHRELVKFARRNEARKGSSAMRKEKLERALLGGGDEDMVMDAPEVPAKARGARS